jgi:hypothetical protein
MCLPTCLPLLPPLPTAAWTVDEKLHTFVAVASDQAAGPPANAWKLRQPSSEQQEVPASQQVGRC